MRDLQLMECMFSIGDLQNLSPDNMKEEQLPEPKFVFGEETAVASRSQGVMTFKLKNKRFTFHRPHRKSCVTVNQAHTKEKMKNARFVRLDVVKRNGKEKTD
ncbi:hypothetical protein Bca4012_048242 [Brassica carinata]